MKGAEQVMLGSDQGTLNKEPGIKVVEQVMLVSEQGLLDKEWQC